LRGITSSVTILDSRRWLLLLDGRQTADNLALLFWRWMGDEEDWSKRALRDLFVSPQDWQLPLDVTGEAVPPEYVAMRLRKETAK
jgi:hypothetical protein